MAAATQRPGVLERINRWFTGGSLPEVPLIWTKDGNVPIASLQYSTRWEDTEDYVKLIEVYRDRDGVVVKESAHVLSKKSLETMVKQGGFG